MKKYQHVMKKYQYVMMECHIMKKYVKVSALNVKVIAGSMQ